MTEIYALGYGAEGFRKLGSIGVEGTVKNQYSLDEFNGILRVVTTTGGTSYLADKYLVTEAGLFYGEPGGERVKTERILSCLQYCPFARFCTDRTTDERKVLSRLRFG